MNHKGKFFAFEGIDGSGKGTQIRLLTEHLRKEGIPFFQTLEPSDSPTGALIHQVMIGRIQMPNDALAALFVADRLDHVQNPVNGILQAMEQGRTVISDRYYFSSYAYQSVDVPMDWIIAANTLVTEKLRPTATIFIDVDPEITMQRVEDRGETRELFENKERLIATRARYFEAIEKLKHEENVIIVDGHRSPEEISEEIWEKVKILL
ncbi:MAG: dTMP kinase [Lachnospiraceae bacterium]|nr:dTMP kinase [Lachnospiraceae bacterium]